MKGLQKLYTLPDGADYRFLPGHSEFLMVCAHPERQPWFVTHDGQEVQVELKHDLPADVAWMVFP